jgi:hypothetical protein
MLKSFAAVPLCKLKFHSGESEGQMETEWLTANEARLRNGVSLINGIFSLLGETGNDRSSF